MSIEAIENEVPDREYELKPFEDYFDVLGITFYLKGTVRSHDDTSYDYIEWELIELYDIKTDECYSCQDRFLSSYPEGSFEKPSNYDWIYYICQEVYKKVN